MNNTKDLSVQPWYRQPWPWLLMLGPAVVVVAGIATAWIAYSTSDGLVAEDYYKKGLVVDQVLARSREARDCAFGRVLRPRRSMPRSRPPSMTISHTPGA